MKIDACERCRSIEVETGEVLAGLKPFRGVFSLGWDSDGYPPCTEGGYGFGDCAERRISS